MAFVGILLTLLFIVSVVFWRNDGRESVLASPRTVVFPFESQAHAEPSPAPVFTDDASRFNQTEVAEIVHIRAEDDVKSALDRARRTGKHISIAGRRHSMGGQSFDRDNIVLDMLGFRPISLHTLTQLL